MHKEHQRPLSDSQMDDLNVTLARAQRQSSEKRKPWEWVEEAASWVATPNFSHYSIPFYLSVVLSIMPVSDSLISHTPVAPFPLSFSLVVHSSSLSFCFSVKHLHNLIHCSLFSLVISVSLSWSALMEERPVLMLLLTRNGKQSPRSTPPPQRGK